MPVHVNKDEKQIWVSRYFFVFILSRFQIYPSNLVLNAFRIWTSSATKCASNHPRALRKCSSIGRPDGRTRIDTDTAYEVSININISFAYLVLMLNH